MAVLRYDNHDVAPEHRFAQWQEKNAQAPMACRVASESTDDFFTVRRAVDLGTVMVSVITSPVCGTARTSRQVKRSDPGIYRLNVVVDGACRFVHDEVEGSHRAGGFFLENSSVPCRDRLLTASDAVTYMGMQVPRALLPLPEKKVDALTGVAFDGTGMGGLLVRHMLSLFSAAEDTTPADDTLLGPVTVDLLAAVLASRLGEDGLAAGAGHRTLRLRIEAFIDAHLADRDLSPQMIADAHRISLRHLHKVFSGTGLTVAAHIRWRRLERARRDLADPALAALPVHQIAARCGLTDPSHFRRVFRREFGTTPADYRVRQSIDDCNHVRADLA
ncbi:helix-turn-helix domain-containing protein [Spirillospora sp. NPDC048911]|uniref:helix-turn-helix domain-containing protein n=1 Tax=Spirillospora sp. NPDC048911 TaxID=3364527 RepID=UPI003722EE1A